MRRILTIVFLSVFCASCVKAPEAFSLKVKGFSKSIVENSFAKLGQITIETPNIVVQYSIADSFANTIVKVTANGEVFPKERSSLDFELFEELHFDVQVAYGKHLENAAVSIILTDIPDHLDFTSDPIYVDENPIKGQVLDTIKGYSDFGTINYHIKSSGLPGAVLFNSSDNTLRVDNETLINYEQRKYFYIVIRAEDGNLHLEKTITVHINDLPDSLSTQEKLDGGAKPIELINSGKATVDDLMGLKYYGGYIIDINTGKKTTLVANIKTFASFKYNWAFGCKSTPIGTFDTSFGSGQANTATMISQCSSGQPQIFEYYRNGQLWYLPSLAEMRFAYHKLKSFGATFAHDPVYWTSSEIDKNKCYAFNTESFGDPAVPEYKGENHHCIGLKEFKE